MLTPCTAPFASQRIVELNQRNGSEDPALARVLRLSVEPGGCSGFQYCFELEDRAQLDEQDRVFEKDGAHVAIDEASLELLAGSTIDFEDEVCSVPEGEGRPCMGRHARARSLVDD